MSRGQGCKIVVLILLVSERIYRSVTRLLEITIVVKQCMRHCDMSSLLYEILIVLPPI